MGVVYLAVLADDAYRKEVAIKLIRFGLDTGFAVRRFKEERQILAELDHPNIARLLDGGNTEDALPYFVIELVHGQPIDEYCQARELTIIQRLKLFQQVCSAVQYAHRHLIVHRDIKPGNILITSEGTPKLLDFGIAKILDAEALAPRDGVALTSIRMLTPEYASPEQIRGETVTTASDVYSLGAVLYKLMTGCSAYGQTSRLSPDLAHAICEQESQRPSAVVARAATGPHSKEKFVRSLRGDLDNIILKSLQKAPERRYASVEQFSEDLGRFIDGLPVTARTDSVAYRTSMFIGRHKAGVIAAALVVIALLAAVVLTARQARIADRERARAEANFNDVRDLANSLVFDLHDAIKDLPGATPARKLLVTKSSSISGKTLEGCSRQSFVTAAGGRHLSETW